MALGVSDILHYWEYTDDGLLVPKIGGQPVFSRAGSAWQRMVEGQYLYPGVNTPRFEPDGLRLELSQANLITDSFDVSTANWANNASPTLADAVSFYKGQTAQKMTTDGVNIFCARIQTFGTFGSGSYTAYVDVEHGTANTIRVQVYDATTSAIITYNEFAFATVTCTPSGSYTAYGAKKLFDCYGPNGGAVYRIWVTFTATAGHSGRIEAHCDRSATAGYYTYFHEVNCVNAGLFTSAYEGTRATETFYWDNAPAPQAMVIYCRWVAIMKYNGGITYPRVFQMGSGSTPVIYMGHNSPSPGQMHFSIQDASETKSAYSTMNPSVGDLCEALGVLNADSTVRITTRVNSGAAAGGAAATALTAGLPSAWGSNTFAINSTSSGANKGAGLYQSVKIVKLANLASATDGTADDALFDELKGAKLLVDEDGTYSISNTV